MIYLPERPHLSRALDVFQVKMNRMGIQMAISINKNVFRARVFDNNKLNAHKGVGRILVQFLSYCYEEQFKLDHKGNMISMGTLERPPLDKQDAIFVMYKKWQSECLKKENI